MQIVIGTAMIPSHSMDPTLTVGKKYLFFQQAYLFSDPKRGDIIVFDDFDQKSGGQASEESQRTIFCKRIIGVPGDVIDFKDEAVYINGEKLDEPYAYGVTIPLVRSDENGDPYIADHFEDSDYIKSLFVLVNSEYVSNANLGLLVSAVGTYIRYITEKKEQENKIESEYIGNIGDKISFTCKPELIFSGDSVYGAFYIYKFKDGGNVITWKTNKAIDCDSEVEFIATVKNHSVYRNEKQTEVSRVKIK